MAVDAALGRESGQEGMRGQIGFQMRMTITGDGVPPTPDPKVSPEPTGIDGILPATGVEVRNGLMLGAAVMATGIVLLMWKRRKKRATGE